MSKPIKIIVLCAIGLPLIIALALLSVFLFKDANDFKPTIEEQAKTAGGINLKIQDQLSWSLIPIGLEINKLEILDQDLQHFASADKIIASIDFWSLFSGEPKVETILLDGLNIKLVQISETENNWSNILPEKTAQDTNEPIAENDTENNSNKPENTLNFLVESFQLTNSSLVFESKPQNLNLNIRPFNLVLSNITLDQAFPISMTYSLNETSNKLEIDSSLEASLLVSKDLSQFSLSKLSNSYAIKAGNVTSKPINLNLASDITIDTTTENIDISNLLISLNELAVKGQANIQNYSSNLNVKSGLSIPSFSLKSLLKGLGIVLPEMQSEGALEKVSLSTDIILADKTLSINGLKINLDKSSWEGNISHGLETSASKIRLHGDKLIIDDYLPPASDETNEVASLKEASDNKETSVQNAEEQALLPLDTLRELNIDFELKQDLLSIKTIDSTQIVIGFKASKGKLTQSLTGQLFEGTYTINSSLNTQTKEPAWQTEQSITNLNLAPVVDGLNIEALKEYGSIAGLLNLKGKTQASGNYLSSLKKTAQSNIDFQIDKGAFEGLSLNALTCKGFALINKETVDTSNWPKETPFNTLKGNANLKQQVLNTRFDLMTTGLHANSEGSINLAESNIDILASLKVIGELGDNACRVNEKVKKIGIPVKCEGPIDTPPAELCKLDTSRLGDMAKDLAIEEGKRKANKEIDRALDKHLGDNKEPIKSLLKKLF